MGLQFWVNYLTFAGGRVGGPSVSIFIKTENSICGVKLTML